jgi:hypothetical protein
LLHIASGHLRNGLCIRRADVADEPTPGELSRRLDAFATELRTLIGRAEYSSDQRGLEHRFTDLGHDIEDVRRQHAGDIKDVNDRITREADKSAARQLGWRTLIFTGLVPAAIAGAAILVQIWLSSKG